MQTLENMHILLLMVFGPIAGAFLAYLVGWACTRNGKTDERARDYVSNIITFVTFVLALSLFISYTKDQRALSDAVEGFAGMGLHFTADGFRVVYGLIAAFMWMMSSLFSREYFAHYKNKNRYYLFFLITLGATLGVFLSADFYTTFIFFEIMSFTSYVWVAHDEKPGALRAASTYLAVAVIGGLVMLMGIFLLYHETGTLEIAKLSAITVEILEQGGAGATRIYAAGVCMLFGFGAKAGAFPLHIWLPKAHPVAPAPASALLSGILTKAGMYGVLALGCHVFFEQAAWGTLILLIGICTMVIGAVLAIFSIDLKRTLACSSVSQIGFILVGVGMFGLLGEEGNLAISGSLLHMMNHSLFKLVLFMAAGVVYMNLHKLDLNEIRGFGRNKTLLKVIFALGSLGIMGVPLFSGYISKTLIHESIVEYIELMEEGHVSSILLSEGFMHAAEWIFLFSGGCTVAYMIKIFVAVFVEKNENEETQKKYDDMKSTYMNKVSGAVLLLAAILYPVMGAFPNQVMNPLAAFAKDFLHTEPLHVAYFSLENLKGGAISITIGLLLYFVIIRPLLMKKTQTGKCYVNLWPKYLDLEDYIYRPILLYVLPAVFGFFCRILDSLVDAIVVLLRKTIYSDSPIPHELEEGTVFTNFVGGLHEGFVELFNKLFWKKNPKTSNAKHELALRHEMMAENTFIIKRSMSFGLILFCMGLLITLTYVLMHHYINL